MTHRNIPTGEETLSRQQPTNHRPHLHHSKLGAALKLIRDAETWWAEVCCLLFLAFTDARSSEARLATWDEIDWETNTWHIPAPHMKPRRPHAVPLSSQAIDVLRYAEERTNGEGLIFPFNHGGSCMSTVSLSRIMHLLGIPSTPHEMRSTFRAWAGDNPEIPATTDDSFEARVLVMQMWADHLTETMGPVTPQ